MATYRAPIDRMIYDHSPSPHPPDITLHTARILTNCYSFLVLGFLLPPPSSIIHLVVEGTNGNAVRRNLNLNEQEDDDHNVV
jgi:hypothetical protein